MKSVFLRLLIAELIFASLALAQQQGGGCATQVTMLTMQLSCGPCYYAEPTAHVYGMDLYWPTVTYQCCGGVTIDGAGYASGACGEAKLNTPEMRDLLKRAQRPVLVADCKGGYVEYDGASLAATASLPQLKETLLLPR